MKKLISLVIFMTLVAFISGAISQPKLAEKPAPAPAPTALDKPELEKFSGSIENVDETARVVEVKQRFKKEERILAFTVDDKTKIERGKETLALSSLKKGMAVSVEYRKEGDKNVAVAIKLPIPKKIRKAEEKSPPEPEKK